MKKSVDVYVKLLKGILWVYIVMCFVIAGLNYGYVKSAPESVAHTITWIWLIYENWVKTAFIIVGSILTIKIISISKRSAMRKRNLIGFIVAALVMHIAMPFIANNFELYFFTMPFPWTTTPLRLLDQSTSFYQSNYAAWGIRGIAAALIIYVCVCIVVLIATLLFGRRFQCSTICLFNGFAAEVFAPAMPLIGKRRQPKPETTKALNVLRWVFLGIALLFFFYWILHLLGVSLPVNKEAVAKAESYKYLVGELLAAIFFWIAFTGRGYCAYCPLGTVLGLVSKIADQKITTAHTRCIACNKCNAVCPMSIDIKTIAIKGADVKDIRCVGCGHCVDACPTENLRYDTRFLQRVRNRASKHTDMDIKQPLD